MCLIDCCCCFDVHSRSAHLSAVAVGDRMCSVNLCYTLPAGCVVYVLAPYGHAGLCLSTTCSHAQVPYYFALSLCFAHGMIQRLFVCISPFVGTACTAPASLGAGSAAALVLSRGRPTFGLNSPCVCFRSIPLLCTAVPACCISQRARLSAAVSGPALRVHALPQARR